MALGKFELMVLKNRFNKIRTNEIRIRQEPSVDRIFDSNFLPSVKLLSLDELETFLKRLCNSGG